MVNEELTVGRGGEREGGFNAREARPPAWDWQSLVRWRMRQCLGMRSPLRGDKLRAFGEALSPQLTGRPMSLNYPRSEGSSGRELRDRPPPSSPEAPRVPFEPDPGHAGEGTEDFIPPHPSMAYPDRSSRRERS